MDDHIKSAKDGIGLVADLLKAAGDNPEVREAGANLGQTALTITRTINNALLPLAAVNFAFDKARRYFAEKFESDLQSRTRALPYDQIVEPKASIAGPALQGLAFTHEEPDLRDMYLSLLATAMDRRSASSAHPAFVEIIKQLEGDEAQLLRIVLTTSGSLPIVQVRQATVGKQGWREIANHLMNLCDTTTRQAIENPTQPAMVDNWVRLGLVEVTYNKYLMDEQAYAWVDERPEYKRLKGQRETEEVRVSFERGCIGRTAFGLKFAAAVGLLSEPRPAPPFEGAV